MLSNKYNTFSDHKNPEILLNNKRLYVVKLYEIIKKKTYGKINILLDIFFWFKLRLKYTRSLEAM